MWFIGVEVEQETSEPAPKKILDPPLQVMTGYGIHEMKYMKGQEDLSNKCLKRTLIQMFRKDTPLIWPHN